MSEGPSRSIGLVNRVVCFSAYGYALYFGSRIPIPTAPVKSVFRLGCFKYFTIWNLAIHFSFFGLCLLCELLPYMKRRSPKKMRDLIYHSLVVPIGLFIALAFWGIHTYDPELMIPEQLRPLFPAWYNHIIHTMIVPGLLIEGVCYYHRLPERRTGVKLLLTVLTSYGAVVLYYGYFRRFWVYPVLDVLPLPGKILFMVASVSVVMGHYYVGEKINKLQWRSRIKED